MEDNQLPDPDSVKVDQWLNYFEGVNSENKKEELQVDQTKNAKDVQFTKAVILFGEALSSAEPADVQEFEDVLDLLKKSVDNDPKRLEFKAIVEKTIEIVKRLE